MNWYFDSSLVGSADKVIENREYLPDLFPIALFLTFGKICVRRVDLTSPTLDLIGRNRQGSIWIGNADAVHVALPVGPSFMFCVCESFEDVARDQVIIIGGFWLLRCHDQFATG